MTSLIKKALKPILFFAPSVILTIILINQTYQPFSTTTTYTATPKKVDNRIHIDSTLDIDDFGRFHADGEVYFTLSRLPQLTSKAYLEISIITELLPRLEYTTYRTDRSNDPLHEHKDWKPLTFPNYDSIHTSDGVTVLAKKEHSLPTIANANLADWITRLPLDSTIGTLTDTPIAMEAFLNTNPQTSPQHQTTNIPWHIRGSVSFYLFTQNETLDISFTKEDINRYEGKDQYSLILKSLEGETIYSTTIDDDGNQSTNYVQTPQIIDTSIPVPEPGVYILVFENYLATKSRQITTDSSIRDIYLNVPNIVTTGGEVTILSSTSFYTSLSDSSTIKLQNKKSQEEYVLTYPPEIQLIKTPITQTTIVNNSFNEKAAFQINSEGEIKIEGVYLAPSSDSYFTPFTIIRSQVDPDIWLIPSQGQNILDIQSKLRKGEIGIGIRALDHVGNITNLLSIDAISFTLTKPYIWEYL